MKKYYRHELKYLVPIQRIEIIKNNLRHVMQLDKHAPEGSYHIRSIYFDSKDFRAYHDVIGGHSVRCKHRVRFYNLDTSHMTLERKYKQNNMTLKTGNPINEKELMQLFDGDTWKIEDNRPVLNELMMLIQNDRYFPACIIDYERIPYVYALGNVRVTIDYNISVVAVNKENWNNDLGLNIPLLEKGYCILEVKYDTILPDFIRQMLQLDTLVRTSYSKYAMGIARLKEFKML